MGDKNRLLTLEEVCNLPTDSEGYAPVWLEVCWYEFDDCQGKECDDCEVESTVDCKAFHTALVAACLLIEPFQKGDVFRGIDVRASDFGVELLIESGNFTDDEYNEREEGWRCWLQKPTDEERAATPWD